MRLVHVATAPLWFLLGVLGAGVQCVGAGIMWSGAWLHDATLPMHGNGSEGGK